jgi:two-component system sensor histidine kinase KdpD
VAHRCHGRVVLLASVFMLCTAEELLGRAGRCWPAPRNLTGHALAAELALLLGLVLARWGGQLSPAADMLCLLLAVIAVALVGGLIPAVAEAVAGSLLLHFLVTPQSGKPALAGGSGAAMLGLLVSLAVVVGLLAEHTTRYIRQAKRAAEAARLMAEADRIRTALVTAVSHDLRPPLTSAAAAVSCLRRPGIQLTAERHDQLLATVEASLDPLARAAASLLDMSQQQTHSIDS